MSSWSFMMGFERGKRGKGVSIMHRGIDVIPGSYRYRYRYRGSWGLEYGDGGFETSVGTEIYTVQHIFCVLICVRAEVSLDNRLVLDDKIGTL